MPIQVVEALDVDTAEIVTVVSKSGGSYVDGLFVSGAETTKKALASVQPPTPEQLQTLEEAERTKDIRVFYINKKVITGGISGGEQADEISHKGIRYKVIGLGDWSSYGYQFAIGAKVQ